MEVSVRFDDENGNAALIRAYGDATGDEFVIDMKRVGRGENPNFQITRAEAVKLRSVITSYLGDGGTATAIGLKGTTDDA